MLDAIITSKGAAVPYGAAQAQILEDVDFQSYPSPSDLVTLAYLVLHEYVYADGETYKWTAKGAAVTWPECVLGTPPAVEDAALVEDVDYVASPNGAARSTLPELAYLVLHGYAQEP